MSTPTERPKQSESAVQAWFHALWKGIKRHWKAMIIVSILAAIIASIISVILFGWNWTGFNGGSPKITTKGETKDSEQSPVKNLWDWLQLLIAPAAIALGVAWFTHAQQERAREQENAQESAREIERHIKQKHEKEHDNEQRAREQELAKERAETDRHIALDNQREAALQEYIKAMSELLLKEKLRKSKPYDEVRTIARVRTITVLHQLDARRIGYIFAFLRESGLMSNKLGSSIVTFNGADLRRINFRNADLHDANLEGADLREADLNKANLNRANLSNAILWHSNLNEAKLWEANLYYASLRGANISGAFLWNANLSDADFGATLSVSNLNLGGAYLHRVALSGARPRGAILSVANLSGADLREANLRRGHLHGANLSRVDLSDAYLISTDLSDASLSDADLSGADLRGAKMNNKTDLRGAKLQGAKYNIKVMQEKDPLGTLVTIEPTQWPKDFDPKTHGAICVDCKTP